LRAEDSLVRSNQSPSSGWPSRRRQMSVLAALGAPQGFEQGCSKTCNGPLVWVGRGYLGGSGNLASG
jgi:hypothetical protein